MLIIEGSDLVGKTTFARKLVEYLNGLDVPVIYAHFGLLPASWNYYWDYLDHMNRRVVMDRFIMSEVVYGAACRGHSQIDASTYRLLDARIRLYNGVTVVMTAKPTFIEEQYTKHKDRETFQLDDVLAVNALYREIAARHRLRFGQEEWVMDVDHWINVTDADHYACDANVERVANTWLERYNQLDSLLERAE